MDIEQLANQYRTDLIEAFNKIDTQQIQEVVNVIREAYQRDKTVFVFGNGGSASTASHLACDWGKGTLKDPSNMSEKRFKIISLTDNMATITALGNDLSYEDIFVQQLRNLIQEGDVVIGISASGNSPNVVKALKYAKEYGANTVGFLGFKTGGKAKEYCDISIVVDSNSYGIVEDLHLILNHLLTTCLTHIKRVNDLSS